jgi:hypothetical protein
VAVNHTFVSPSEVTKDPQKIADCRCLQKAIDIRLLLFENTAVNLNPEYLKHAACWIGVAHSACSHRRFRYRRPPEHKFHDAAWMILRKGEACARL